MGNFFSLSCVVGADTPPVVTALETMARARGGGMRKEPGEFYQPNIGVVLPRGDRVTVLYPEHFAEWDDFSRYLSRRLERPVFSFHVHDGDLWMYILFDQGEDVDRFNPIPDYWDPVDIRESARWRGSASLVCRYVPDLQLSAIERYLVRWDTEDLECPRAYPDDEHEQGEWQLCDFMRKLGFAIPWSDEGTPPESTYRIWTEDLPLRTPRKKRWKFW